MRLTLSLTLLFLILSCSDGSLVSVPKNKFSEDISKLEKEIQKKEQFEKIKSQFQDIYKYDNSINKYIKTFNDIKLHHKDFLSNSITRSKLRLDPLIHKTLDSVLHREFDMLPVVCDET